MCNREQDILDALQSGRWDDDLRRHFASCSDCADLALVAGALREESDLAYQEVRVPSSSFLWWKSKLRARREAEQKILQPVRVAEKAALAAGATIAAGAIWWFWPEGVNVAASTTLMLGIGIGAAVVSLAGVLVYAAVAKD